MSLELLRTHDCVDLDGGDEEEEDDEEGGGDGEDEGEGGDAGGEERSRRPMGQEGGSGGGDDDDDDDEDYDDFDQGDERAQAGKQVDWKSGQLSSVVGRMADAERLFDATMEEVSATPLLSMVACPPHGSLIKELFGPCLPLSSSFSSSSSCLSSYVDACRAARGEGSW